MTLNELHVANLFISPAQPGGTPQFAAFRQDGQAISARQFNDETLVEITDLFQLTAAAAARDPDRSVFAITHGRARFRVTRFHDLGDLWYCIRRPLITDIDLDMLKIDQRHVSALVNLGTASGLVLIAGPANAGKTTTSAALRTRWLNDFGGIAFSIENPVEIALRGIINPNAKCFHSDTGGNDCTGEFNRIIQCAPRYINIGEILAYSEAVSAVRAALSGHLVTATIHGGTPIEALSRLISLNYGPGAEPPFSQVAAALTCIYHQRIVGADARVESSILIFDETNESGLRTKIRLNQIEQLESDIVRQAVRFQSAVRV